MASALKTYLRKQRIVAAAVAAGAPIPFVGRNERRRQRSAPYLDDWGHVTRTNRWRSKNLAKVNNRDMRRGAL